MNNQTDSIKACQEIVELPGNTGNVDKIAFACNTLLILIFLYDQLMYGMNMLFLTIPLACIEIYLIVYGLVSDKYCFNENALEIRHRFRKTVVIQYESVFNYEASLKDTLLNVTKNNSVKLYYEQGKRKKTVVCRPKDAETFVDVLKQRCPEFFSDNEDKTKLNVFFNNDKKA